MNYNDFKDYILTEIRERIEGSEPEYREILKNNGICLDGLIVNRKDSKISPTLYMNDFFDSYQKGANLEEITDVIANILKNNTISKDFDVEDFFSFERIKDRIVMKVINLQMNEKLLSDVPYREFLDLAVCYYVYISDNNFDNASVLINNSHAKMWNLTEEELFETASVNTKKILKSELCTMTETLRRIMENDNKDEDFGLNLLENDDCGMYILSNSSNHYGASSILDRDVLKNFADEIDSDFYILPSSVHELILLPTTNVDSVESLNEMIVEVNETQVPKQDILSDHAYYYNRRTASVTFC